MAALKAVVPKLAAALATAAFWLIALIALAAAFLIGGTAVLAGAGWALIVSGLFCLATAAVIFSGVRRHG